MYSTSSRTKHRDTDAGPGNKSTIKNCQLCFSEWDEKNGHGHNPKLQDLCCKYLHSSLTQELSIGSDDHPFCPRCFVTGTEIITLYEQMEIIQKSLSDLVFMFSLGILHRRGKIIETEKIPVKKIIEFDVSALPNNESWNMIPQEFDASVSSPEYSHQIIPGNIFIENVGQTLVPEIEDNQGHTDDSIGEIKITIANDLKGGCSEVPAFEETFSNANPCVVNESGQQTIEEGISSVSFPEDFHQIKPESLYIQNAEDYQNLCSDATYHQSSNDNTIGDIVNYETMCTPQVWNEEDTNNSEERGTSQDTPYLNDTQLLTNTEVPLKSKSEQETGGNSTLSNNRLKTPIIKLQKLSFLNEGIQIIDEYRKNDQLSTNMITIWAKRDSGSSFRLIRQNSELSNEEGSEQLNSLPFHHIIPKQETMTTIASEECIPTASCGQTSERKEISKTSDEDNNIIEKPYKRSLYKQKFKTQSAVNKRSDNVEMPYQCSLCQKYFNNNKSLCNHRQRHHSKRELYKCTYCPKCFHYKYVLTRHLRTHTGEKPFRCDKCDYSSARTESLKYHKNRCHGDQPSDDWKRATFQCTQCPKRFVSNFDLVRHVRTHTGEKPFGCDQCDFSSARETNLKDHKNRRHGSAGLNFNCTTCGCNFKTLKDAKQHFKSVHFALDLSDDSVIELKGKFKI